MPAAAARTFFGVETEFAFVSGTRPSGALVEELFRAAQSTLPHLRDASGRRLWLTNGSCFYVDAGWHPEVATAEVVDPTDAVRYVRAGERILARLLRSEGGPVDGKLFRTNVDYVSGCTWGTHESYLFRGDIAGLARVLIPHLVSRIVYTGAGGFDASSPGIAFSLSPRVHHLTRDIGGDSQTERPIFHTRDEPHAPPGQKRVHLICGESNASDRALWLKLATTALVITLAEQGRALGARGQLVRPLAAMQRFARDPGLTKRARVAGGELASAIELQRAYLAVVEGALGDGAVDLPSWAREAWREWRAVLDGLDALDDATELSLDWTAKRRLFAQHAAQRGFTREQIEQLNAALVALRRQWPAAHDRNAELRPFDLVIGNADEARRAYRSFAPPDAALPDFDAFARLRALRAELFEIDWRFAEIGRNGLHAQLETVGLAAHRVRGAEDVEPALTEPPSEGRARLRGEWVRKLAHEPKALCDWRAVWRPASQGDGFERLDLTDPFTTVESWVPEPAGGPNDAIGRMLRLRQRGRERLDGVRLIRELSGHAEPVSWLEWSCDGLRLASSSTDGTVRLWDDASGSAVATLEGHADWVRLVRWDRRGALLASAAKDGEVRLWSRDGIALDSARVSEGSARSLAWSDRGELAVGYCDGTVRIWAVERGEAGGARFGAHVETRPHRDVVYSLAWCPDGSQRLASASSDGSIAIGTPAARAAELRIRPHGGDVVREVAWYPDGRRLASSGGDGRVLVHDFAGEPRVAGREDVDVFTVQVSADGRWLAYKTALGVVQLLDAERLSVQVAIHERTDDAWPRGLAFHPVLDRLAIRGAEGRGIRIWQIGQPASSSAAAGDGAP